jgi:hypothetical protein
MEVEVVALEVILAVNMVEMVAQALFGRQRLVELLVLAAVAVVLVLFQQEVEQVVFTVVALVQAV